MAESSGNVTELLLAWRSGNQEALARLTPLIYGELHRLAHRYMGRERAGDVLQTTELVHEAYLRLVDCDTVGWRDRAHFLAIAAQSMRRILVDFARRRRSQKRGGLWQMQSFDDALAVAAEPENDFTALDDALNELARMDARKARVVELRFFGGLSVEEVACVLEVSTDTIGRDWNAAKAWLLRTLARSSSR
jgi:RNA polymerase sigma factor (TIGR02999 family)